MSGIINGTQELKGNISEKESLQGNIPITVGVSPTIEVHESIGLHDVFITDINGRKSFTVYDGQDGKDGQDGRDGVDGKDYILTEDDKNEIAELIIGEKAPAITNTASGESIVVTDSANAPLQSMKVFGKSWQDGTPTVNARQDIHSHGESGSIEYGLYGANLFNAENPNFLLKATNISVAENKVTFTTSDQYGQFGNEYTDLPSGTYAFGYESVDYSGAVEVRAYYGSNGTLGTQIARTTTEKSITFDYDSTQGDLVVWTRPNAATTIAYTGLCLCVGNTPIHEEYKEVQPLTLQTPNGLNGLKVTKQEEANYTDSDGNMWACDYIDLQRGKYVQRIIEKVLDGSKAIGFNNSGKWHMSFNELFGNGDNILQGSSNGGFYAISNTFLLQSARYNCDSGFENHMFFSSTSDNKAMSINVNLFETPNESGFKKFFSEHPTIIRAILKTPIETDLSAEEIAQYEASHTNYPNTTIINDANAYTEIGYVADTKMYIDKKFNELTSAIAQLL